MQRKILLLPLFLLSCGNSGGSFADPPPAPALSEEEALRLAAERSRQERDRERGVTTLEEPVRAMPPEPPMAPREVRPVSSARPFNAEETRILHDALAPCTDKPVTLEVWAEPGGLPFLAPGQRFPETDLECFARQLGTVRLAPERQRRGVVTLP